MAVMATRAYRDAFLTTYRKLHDSSTGYFSAGGIPYHAVETAVVEAPSHGHETTSEAASYWIYLEALYGYSTGDWEPLRAAWSASESFFIPRDQASFSDYNPQAPATYAAERDTPSEYPTPLDKSVAVGRDPLFARLAAKHGPVCYSMHWLGDPDNMYGFGPLFNTFQRGPMESCWDTIPQPCRDDKTSGGPNGYLDLFVKQDGAPPGQWKYTCATDADARCIQAVFFAKWLCDRDQKAGPPADILDKATKLGDWLMYGCYDKFFMRIGTQSRKQPGNANDDAFHGLLSWYTAFGGPLQKQGWAFRIGSSHSHIGYQNPVAAYALSSSTFPSIFQDQWRVSCDRQLEMFAWLQSEEGAIAGGCTNSWNGRYEDYPAGTRTFHGMAFTQHPVYLNPPSNQWSGMNAWGMERVVLHYFITKDAKLRELVGAWCRWVAKNVIKKETGTVLVPSTLQWTGAPDSDWNGGGFPRRNTQLKCKVTQYGQDVGVMASFARSLLLYCDVEPDTACKAAASTLLDALPALEGPKGYSVAESRADYTKFDTPVFVPAGFKGKTPHGEVVDRDSTFYSLRKSLYQDDVMLKDVRRQLAAGKTPRIRVHRFWAQCEVALTFAFADFLGQKSGTTTPATPVKPTKPTGTTATPAKPTKPTGATTATKPATNACETHQAHRGDNCDTIRRRQQRRPWFYLRVREYLTFPLGDAALFGLFGRVVLLFRPVEGRNPDTLAPRFATRALNGLAGVES
jgi:hypothetical protein